MIPLASKREHIDPVIKRARLEARAHRPGDEAERLVTTGSSRTRREER